MCEPGEGHYKLKGVVQCLEAADRMANVALTRELEGPWCDLLADILQEEWKSATRLLKAFNKQTPSTVDALLPTVSPTFLHHYFCVGNERRRSIL